MKGLELTLSNDKTSVYVKMEPLLLDAPVEAKTILQAFNQSDFSDYYLDERAVFTACDTLKASLESSEMSTVQVTIAHAKDAVIEIAISGDKMSAELTINSPFMGKMPSLEDIFEVLAQHEIVRGISKKRITSLIEKASASPGGRHFTNVVAKGLPPRNGKDSYIKALVPNALERVLAPQDSGEAKLDMRDFGKIICIDQNQACARRMPPTTGRIGYTVTGKKLEPDSGDWRPIKLGKQVKIDLLDENLVRAKIAGLPKVSNSKIEVDNVLETKGVNVGTGHINFEGSVIVTGDITEKMRVVASGNITINGFVESAYLKAGGDIVVTQGATGKLNQIDCEFDAGGNVYLVHAQGVKIQTGKDLIVEKQLAYSHIKCMGNVIVGKVKKPLGKLFASTIRCRKTVTAGYLGAVSGSSLVIDYSEAYTEMIDKHERLTAQFEDLASKNADHEIKIASIKNRKPSGEILRKVELMTEELELERVFINWLRINVEESKEKLAEFQREAIVRANKSVHPGVSVRLDINQWVAKKEYGKCKIILENKRWIYEPAV
jgi:uncharacterized protein (DUF342 family)